MNKTTSPLTSCTTDCIARALTGSPWVGNLLDGPFIKRASCISDAALGAGTADSQVTLVLSRSCLSLEESQPGP